MTIDNILTTFKNAIYKNMKMTELSIFLKKVAKTFVNRNGNVVPLQRQKGNTAKPCLRFKV